MTIANLRIYENDFKTLTFNSTERRIKMKDKLTEYLNDHSDVIITVAILIVLDHLILDGTGREKIKALFDKLVNRTEKALDAPKKAA